MDEIIPILEKYNFKVVDTDNMTLEEQSLLLGNTRYLIAIHGAGLTNMVFRRNSAMDILEIFPPSDVVPYHYAILARRYQFGYRGIMGEEPNAIKGYFKLDPIKLERSLIRMLSC